MDAGYRAARPEGDEHLPGEPSSARGDVTILRNVSFGLEAGDRVALLGPNGAGKSTLVKTLVGELPTARRRAQRRTPDLRIGYFAQHTVESLRAGADAAWTICAISPRRPPTQDMRSFLGRWYFSGERAFENRGRVSPAASGRAWPWP